MSRNDEWGWKSNALTIELRPVYQSELHYSQQWRSREIEWVGVVLDRSNRTVGAIGRLRSNGKLIQAKGTAIHVLRESIAKRVSAALDEKLREALHPKQGATPGDLPSDRVPAKWPRFSVQRDEILPGY